MIPPSYHTKWDYVMVLLSGSLVLYSPSPPASFAPSSPCCYLYQLILALLPQTLTISTLNFYPLDQLQTLTLLLFLSSILTHSISSIYHFLEIYVNINAGARGEVLRIV